MQQCQFSTVSVNGKTHRGTCWKLRSLHFKPQFCFSSAKLSTKSNLFSVYFTRKIPPVVLTWKLRKCETGDRSGINGLPDVWLLLSNFVNVFCLAKIKTFSVYDGSYKSRIALHVYEVITSGQGSTWVNDIFGQIWPIKSTSPHTVFISGLVKSET